MCTRQISNKYSVVYYAMHKNIDNILKEIDNVNENFFLERLLRI